MSLLKIILSLDRLAQPNVSLDTQGIKLAYTDASHFERVHPSLLVFCNKLGIITDFQTMIIPHRHMFGFLMEAGATEMGLRDAIELFYLEKRVDRAKFLAQESLNFIPTAATAMSCELLTLVRVALGPKPNQLLAEMAIQMPKATIDELARPSRVAFLLDCSGSMNEGNRLGLLKPAVISAIDQLPPDTLVSVYFYSNTVNVVFKNKPVMAITAADRQAISIVSATGGTTISVAIDALTADMKEEGLLEDAQAFENLTVVWLTDGDDDVVKSSKDLVRTFQYYGCMVMPQLIAVGIGEYNEILLNGVAKEFRFKSNLMLHIDSPADIAKLFHGVANCIGVMRKKIIIVMEAGGHMTYQDLGVMQAGQVKQLVMEIAMPADGVNQIRSRVLVDEDVNGRDIDLPAEFNLQNIDLLVTYFTQVLDDINIAMHSNPAAAVSMRACALASIPSTVRDAQLLALRKSFMSPQEEFSLLEDNSIGWSCFQPAVALRSTSTMNNERQSSLSQSLQRQYTQVVDTINIAMHNYPAATATTPSLVRDRPLLAQQQPFMKRQYTQNYPRGLRESMQSEKIVLDKTGKIKVEQSLSNFINAQTEKGLGKEQLRISQLGFLNSDLGPNFRIALERINTNVSKRDLLKQFYALFKINSSHVRVESQSNNNDMEIYFADVGAILKLFKEMNYGALLNDEKLCLALQVDLLQLLITDAIRAIIIRSKISHHQPEMIEFDSMGNLSAVVISPNNVRYKLKDTHEVCCFLKKYCKCELPPHFVELIRRQVEVNARRYTDYLALPNAENLPRIFADNQLVAIQICETKKQLSAFLDRRLIHTEPLNPQERRFFQKQLAQALGNNFLVDWRSSDKHYRLIIACANMLRGFTSIEVNKLADVLRTCQLLTDAQIADLRLPRLMGVPRVAAPAMSESVEDILACKILFGLPDGIPLITPMGHSYDEAAIAQHIVLLKKEPTDPVSRQPLDFSNLRQNQLAKRLIDYYTSLSTNAYDPDVQAPALLIDPLTGIFYSDPVVLPNGETVSRENAGEEKVYPNRCVAELIAYYESTLEARQEAVVRLGLRATIGANVGLLCPGVGALTIEAAKDETDVAVPYVEYDTLTATLSIHFASQDYARHFELGLKRWGDYDQCDFFVAGNVVRETMQCKKTVRGMNGEQLDMVFHSTVSVQGDRAILVLFEQLCGLSSAYFTELKKLSGSESMDIFNHLIQEKLLGDWSGDIGFSPLFDDASSSSDLPPSILGIRAASSNVRMGGKTVEDVSSEDREATIFEQAQESQRFFRLKGKTPLSSGTNDATEQQIKKSRY